jgi:hypothetical protein
MNCIKECHSNNMMSCVGIVMTCGARSFAEPTCTKVYSFFFCKPFFSFHLQWTLLEEKENEMKIKNGKRCMPLEDLSHACDFDT